MWKQQHTSTGTESNLKICLSDASCPTARLVQHIRFLLDIFFFLNECDFFQWCTLAHWDVWIDEATERGLRQWDSFRRWLEAASHFVSPNFSWRDECGYCPATLRQWEDLNCQKLPEKLTYRHYIYYGAVILKLCGLNREYLEIM